MNTEKKQKTTLLKLLMNMPKGIFEIMTDEQKLKIRINFFYFSNEINKNLENLVKVSEVEKEFLYTSNNIEYRNYLVKKYPKYFEDFHFLDLHTKYRTNLKNEHKVPVNINPSDKSIIENFHSKINIHGLKYFFDDWNKNIIKNDNLYRDDKTKTDKLLNELKREAKIQIKDFKVDLKNNGQIFDENFSPNFKYTMFVLHTKYIYLICSKIKETFNNGKCFHPIFLNNKEIRFSEMSLVHILIRHYSPLSKISAKNMMKSNHKKDFLPEELHLDLAFIFKEIDNSRIFKNSNLFKNVEIENQHISFKFKENIYCVWISLNKNENETGQIPFIEIETFHPLDDTDELKKLHSGFRNIKINNHLSIYIENHSIENICLN